MSVLPALQLKVMVVAQRKMKNCWATVMLPPSVRTLFLEAFQELVWFPLGIKVENKCIYIYVKGKNTGDRPSRLKEKKVVFFLKSEWKPGNEKTKPKLQLHLNYLRAHWTLPGRSGRSCFEWEETVMTTKLRHVTKWKCVSLGYQTLSETGIQRPYNKSFWGIKEAAPVALLMGATLRMRVILSAIYQTASVHPFLQEVVRP